jgi:segregation and condensation protein A
VPTVSTEHIHAPFVSVREQARRLAGRLRRLGRASFRQLTTDCEATNEIVASFLALLELYREDRIALEQIAPLGDIYVTWNAAGDDGDDDVAHDADEGTIADNSETT